jgi:D-3-phosphoglycerate dehydrogenase
MITIANISTRHDCDYEKDAFSKYNADYIALECQKDDEIIAFAKNADVILFDDAVFSAELLDNLPNLKLLVRYGVGYDNVDLAHARKLGIDVCNTPSYGSYDVAEHSFALLMAVNRKLVTYDRNIRAGMWDREIGYLTYRLENKTLGIVGYGRIGKNIAKFAKAFNMRVVIYDPFVDISLESSDVKNVDFDTLLMTSDFISVNAPLTEKTRHMFNLDAFKKMKPSAIIVNTSRGALVKEGDLLLALRNKMIRGAGLDVYENMPSEIGNPFHSLDNVVMTPHVAWDSVEAVTALHKEVVDEVVRFIEKKPLKSVVNQSSSH